MTLTRYKLGDLIKQHNERCANRSVNRSDISGVNRDKEFFPSRQVGSDVSNYKVVPAGYFACNLMHVGRDIVLPIAYNRSNHEVYVSPAYTVFCIKKDAPIDAIYLEMWFKSDERDRYFWMHTDSSIRDGMAYDDMCDIEIDLPPIEIQKKYVDIYNVMIANQACYEHGLEDLKITCDAYIENLRREIGAKQIAQHIHEKSNKVSDSNKQYRSKDIAGISSVEKRFMETKADTGGVFLGSYKIVEPNDFSFNPNTARMGDRIPIALNDTDKDLLVSAIYPVFSVDESLEPEYLMMWFKRSEFDRYARFNSWGSARETFDFPDMKEVEIPIPSKDIQRAIVDIYESYTARKDICDHLKTQIISICPILIKGSLEEANK